MTYTYTTQTITTSGVPITTTNDVSSELMSKNQVADATIVKVDEDKRQVFGWASIIKDEGGKILLDRQDDFIDSEDELEKAAYDYVLRSRDGGEMHVRRGVSKMIESVVFTEEKQRAMGIPTGAMPTGWWIGFQVEDDRVWQQVKKGDYAGFSVHGTGKRESTELSAGEVTEIGKAGDKKKKNKIATVMGEFKAGKLKSSSGEVVTDPKQAMAIAISEQKKAKVKKVSLSEITKKKEELGKVGDRPGHPFRGNQHTGGKGRGAGSKKQTQEPVRPVGGGGPAWKTRPIVGGSGGDRKVVGRTRANIDESAAPKAGKEVVITVKGRPQKLKYGKPEKTYLKNSPSEYPILGGVSGKKYGSIMPNKSSGKYSATGPTGKSLKGEFSSAQEAILALMRNAI